MVPSNCSIAIVFNWVACRRQFKHFAAEIRSDLRVFHELFDGIADTQESISKILGQAVVAVYFKILSWSRQCDMQVEQGVFHYP